MAELDGHFAEGERLAGVIRENLRAGGNVFMVKPTSPSMMGEVLAEIEAGDLGSTDKQLINRHGRRSYNQ